MMGTLTFEGHRISPCYGLKDLLEVHLPFFPSALGILCASQKKSVEFPRGRIHLRHILGRPPAMAPKVPGILKDP